MIGLVVYPTFTKLSILIDFKINQDLITELFCINKEEPITVCSGKCYLSKELKKADDSEKNATIPVSKLDLPYVLFTCQTSTPQSYDSVNEKQLSGFLSPLYDSIYILNIFHPPQLNLI